MNALRVVFSVRLRLLVFVLAVGGTVVSLSGCVSQEKVARDLQSRRQWSVDRLAAHVGDPNAQFDGVDAIVRGPLTLAAAVELAMNHNKDVQGAYLKLMEAEGRMTEAIATALPTVDISGSAMANDDESGNLSDESYQFGITARQPLYLGGLMGAALDAAAVYEFLSQQELRSAFQQVRYAVSEAYLSATLAMELEEVAVKAVEDARENLRLTEAKYQAGEVLRFEWLRARVRVQEAQAELISRHKDSALAMTGLMNAMGISPLSRITLSEPLLFHPIRIAEGRCHELALSRRPELLVGEAMVRLADDAIVSTQSATRPRLYLQGQWQESRPGMDMAGGYEYQHDWFRTASGGLVLEWSVFDGFATDGQVTQARAERHRQEVMLRKQEQNVRFEVTEALLTLQSSREFVDSQQGNVANAAESLRLARLNYREGIGTSLDVLTQELALANARGDYVLAVYNYESAKLALRKALGIIGEAPLPRFRCSGQSASAAHGTESDGQ